MRKSDRPKSPGNPATPSQPAATAKTSSALLAIAIVLFVVTRFYIAFVLNPRITDITLYFDYSTRAIDRNKEPYRDFSVEYPPVAWWSMCAPRLVDERRLPQNPHPPVNASMFHDYHQAYRLEMALFDVVSFGLFLAIVRKRRPGSAGWAALTYVVTSTILCHVLYDHLDEGTLLFSMLGAYAWTQTLEPRRSGLAWSGAAFFFFGLGFSYKLIPLIAVPFLLLAEWHDAAEREKGTGTFCAKQPGGPFRQKVPVPFSRRWKRLAAGLAGLALGIAGPFTIQYMVSGPGVFALFAHHAGREIQVESLYSTLMWIGSLFGWPISISLSRRRGILRLRRLVLGHEDPFDDLAVRLFGRCGHLGRRTRIASRRAEALGLACYALGACAIFSKVLSPQYFVWSIPLLLLAGVEVLPAKGKSAWSWRAC